MGWFLLGGALAAVGAYLLTWTARRLAPKLGYVDQPSGRKQHARPTPLLGGAALFGAILLAFAVLWTASPDGLSRELFHESGIAWILLSAGLTCLLGLWDDRRPVRPRTKFLGQVLAAIPFAFGVAPLAEFDILGLSIPLGLAGLPLAVFWLVSCTNAVNLVDGHDGLAGSVGAVAAVALAAAALWSGNVAAAALAILLLGAIAGFLVHNWPPARIFLGDAGSMTIGFLIGALALESLPGRGALAVIPAAAILAVAFFDVVVAMLRRKLNGRGIGEADRKHIHHRLLERGLSHRQTLLSLQAMCLAGGAGAVCSVWLASDAIALSVCAGLFAGLIASRLFGYDEIMMLVRRVAPGPASVESATTIPYAALREDRDDADEQRRAA